MGLLSRLHCNWLATGTLSFFAFGAGACNLADGLTDVGGSLSNPDAALIDHPGRKLASGRFHNLLIDGSSSDGGQVIALEETEDGRRLSIIPYLDGEPCTVEPAQNFTRLSSRVDVELPGVLSVQKDSDEKGWGEVVLIDFQCEEVFPSLKDSKLPRQVFPTTHPRGVLNLDARGELLLIAPGKDELEKVAEGVSVMAVSGDTLFTIQEGRLAVFDDDAKLLGRAGNDVTTLYVTGGLKMPVAFLDEDRRLSAWSEESGETLIAEEACSVGALGPDAIGYLSPCEDPEFFIFTTGEHLQSESTYVQATGLEDVTSVSNVQANWGNFSREPEILYISGPSGASQGELRLARLVEERAAEEENGESIPTLRLESESLAEDISLHSGQFFQDFAENAGTLMEVERDKEGMVTGLRSLAEDVVQLPGVTPYSPRGILTDVSEGTGTLRVLSKDDGEVDSRVLAKGVPIQNQTVESETNRTAFIANSEDGHLGTLFLTSGVNPTQRSLVQISEKVLRDTARFLDEPRALAYLYRTSDDSASLRSWLIDAELEVEISPRVSEYRTVPWPAPGILYAVPDGKSAGLWYAKAR